MAGRRVHRIRRTADFPCRPSAPTSTLPAGGVLVYDFTPISTNCLSGVPWVRACPLEGPVPTERASGQDLIEGFLSGGMAVQEQAVPADQGTVESKGTWRLKKGLAEMLKGGVIMDVTTPEQARIAEEAGAVSVMALERVPADVRAEGGVARMADVAVVERICAAVTIPVMGKVRLGHFVEAQILEAVGVDYIDESEVLTPADERYHINKHVFKAPFVCGAKDLGEALRRIAEGAAMIRTKGEPGTGNIVEAVRHIRAMDEQIRRVRVSTDEELVVLGKEWGAPLPLLQEVRELGRLPVVNFAAGGIATPADAALLMQMGCDGVFVGSGIFKSADPAARARAIVRATTHYRDPQVLIEVSRNLGEPMRGLDMATVPSADRMQERGQ